MRRFDVLLVWLNPLNITEKTQAPHHLEEPLWPWLYGCVIIQGFPKSFQSPNMYAPCVCFVAKCALRAFLKLSLSTPKCRFLAATSLKKLAVAFLRLKSWAICKAYAFCLVSAQKSAVLSVALKI
jgi:hypothetical protein